MNTQGHAYYAEMFAIKHPSFFWIKIKQPSNVELFAKMSYLYGRIGPPSMSSQAKQF
jgi:hypothetical protein